MSETTSKVVEYTYDEFWIDLPAHWQQTNDGQNGYVLNWSSPEEQASLTISAEFREVPGEVELPMAQVIVASRKESLEKWLQRPLTVLHESIKPNSVKGYNIAFGVDAGEDLIVHYAGYISNRKILHFSLISNRGKEAAAALYRDLTNVLRVKLP
jgi:hypothetical protein